MNPTDQNPLNNLFSFFSHSSMTKASNTQPLNLRNSKDVCSKTNIDFQPNNNTHIKSFFYQEDKNLKYRQAMEDAGICFPNYTENYQNSLFAIFDGHGGVEVVKFIKDRFPNLIKQTITSNPSKSIEDNLKTSFSKIDSELKYYDSDYTGSTATIIYIENDNLICANVGDSRAFLISKSGPKMISVDHKCSDPNETQRIIKSGGIIKKGRVYGQLILSRTIGDLYVKKYGVINEPSISKNKIIPNTKFCVIASDGLWDVIDQDLLFQISQKFHNAENLAKELVKTAIDKGSQDNVSCVVISFDR